MTVYLSLVILAGSADVRADGDGLQGSNGMVLFEENFESYTSRDLPPGWWVEGGEDAWLEDGRLYVKSDPDQKNGPGYVATVWCPVEIAGDVQVEIDAHVTASTVSVNNINVFLFYSDPSGTPLFETQDSRASGEYGLYHSLNGYIFTFLNAGRHDEHTGKARIRLRRCPGFNLLTETYDYHCREGVTYHVTIRRENGKLSFAVDGTVYLEHEDDRPWAKGLLGLRTYHTDLWWDNLVVTRLGTTEETESTER